MIAEYGTTSPGTIKHSDGYDSLGCVLLAKPCQLRLETNYRVLSTVSVVLDARKDPAGRRVDTSLVYYARAWGDTQEQDVADPEEQKAKKTRP